MATEETATAEVQTRNKHRIRADEGKSHITEEETSSALPLAQFYINREKLPIPGITYSQYSVGKDEAEGHLRCTDSGWERGC